MDATIVTAMAGVLGSLVGGSATAATAWITQRTLAKRDMFRSELDKREGLYGEFIGECSKLLIHALTHSLEDPDQLMPAYALANRIRLSASDAVLKEAEHIIKWITEQYFSRNIAIGEIRELVQSEEADPLRPFAEACRVELKSLRAAL
jgi:hypothetical protein